MKVTVAIDSFKGSLSAFRAGEAAACGIKRVFDDAKTFICPIADGGEGTTDALVYAVNGEKRSISVCGPLGEPVTAIYGILPDGTAVIEMSAAAGLTLVPEHLRNPMKTTTFGVGEMILDAIRLGCRKFIVGIGGSATNDGGIGMLAALGYKFADSNGKSVGFGAKGISEIVKIHTENVYPAVSECDFRVACDVTNPLCGKNGCSAVYGSQKGADAQMMAEMDEALFRYAELTHEVFPQADPDYPGAGAAGGMGFAFLAYLGGKLESGIELVMRAASLEERIADSDVVVTGEGRLDGQSCMGKAPVGIAAIAKKYGKTVVAFSGCAAEDAAACNDFGIDAFFPILKKPCSLSEAMDEETAYRNLADTAEQVFRLIKAVK